MNGDKVKIIRAMFSMFKLARVPSALLGSVTLLECVTLLEEVCHRGRSLRFQMLKPDSVPTSSCLPPSHCPLIFLSSCCLQIEMWNTQLLLKAPCLPAC